MSSEAAPGHGRPGETGLTRSEERLSVSLPVRVRGRVRLRKRVVTEEVTQTFLLRREEFVVQEEPADEPAGVDHELAEDELVIVLHAEQLEVTTRVVPVERVRVRTHVVRNDVPVSGELRREQVEVQTAPAPGEDVSGSAGTAYGVRETD